MTVAFVPAAVVARALDAAIAKAPPEEAAARLGRDFNELAFDSLNFMEFCIAVHVETGIELTAEQARELGSPAGVIEWLGRQA
jgi:acyl carrier protein